MLILESLGKCKKSKSQGDQVLCTGEVVAFSQ